MNKRQAMAIRSAQLKGLPVSAIDLQEAIHVLGSKRSNKMRLPTLRDEIRQKVNLVLMFNLGREIGRSA